MTKTQINHFKTFVENLFNALNLNFIEFDEKKIIYINRDDDVFVDEHIEIDVKKIK